MNPSRTAPPSALTVAAWICGILGILALITSPGVGYLELTGRVLVCAAVVCWVIQAARKRGR